MKKLMLLFLCSSSSTAFAQATDSLVYNSAPNVRIGIPSLQPPLYIINGLVTEGAVFGLIKKESIESVNVITAKEASSVFSHMPNYNGVVIITLKKDVELIGYKKLFKKWKIKQDDYNFPIYINDVKLVEYSNLLMQRDLPIEVDVTRDGKRATFVR